MVELGDEVKDSVSGFRGIAVGRMTYLQGCARISVQPKVGKDGKLPESGNFDEPQLIVLKHKAVVKLETKKDPPGGPVPYVFKSKQVLKTH